MPDLLPSETATKIEALQRLSALHSETRVVAAGRVILSLIANRPGLIDESCVIASRAVAQALQASGFPAVIVEGELNVGVRSWLQHRVVVVELTDEWILIDLAVRQVPAFCDEELYWAVFPPKSETLKSILSTRYAWWTPP